MDYNRSWCMDFSNDEIKQNLINPMLLVADVKCIVDDKYVDYDYVDDFEYITFDGMRQEFYVSLNKCQTSIFIDNEEIMFIDDVEKQYYTLSDVESCIVYEGKLIGKTHKEILELILKFLNIFNHSSVLYVTKKKIPRSYGDSYPKYEYTINIRNPYVNSGQYLFENILINVG